MSRNSTVSPTPNSARRRALSIRFGLSSIGMLTIVGLTGLFTWSGQSVSDRFAIIIISTQWALSAVAWGAVADLKNERYAARTFSLVTMTVIATSFLAPLFFATIHGTNKPAGRNASVENVLAYAERHNYDGVTLTTNQIPTFHAGDRDIIAQSKYLDVGGWIRRTKSYYIFDPSSRADVFDAGKISCSRQRLAGYSVEVCPAGGNGQSVFINLDY